MNFEEYSVQTKIRRRIYHSMILEAFNDTIEGPRAPANTHTHLRSSLQGASLKPDLDRRSLLLGILGLFY
jgi:hypothetical protein